MTGTPQRKHDVFISFRGEDTRRNFTSHLRAAFDRNGIDAFTDEGLRGGDEISPTLSAKIRESKASVLAFSPNFADSRWCLDELVEIMECHAAHGQTVLPVFLQGVEPSHVRNQTGVFGDGIARLSQEARYADKVKSWQLALQQAANLSGWSSDHMSEEEIVENILSHTQSVLDQIYSDDRCQPFIGIERVHKVESILSSPEVRNLGLWGLPGSGKTTLAGKIFQRISKNFDATCFVENVRDHAERHELNSLRNSLLSQLLGKHDQNQGPPVMFRSDFQRRLGRKKVLLVLDDVSDVGQVQELIGDCRLLGPGSKVITTCRDQQVLKIVCDRVFEVKELDEHESLQLIKLHMFKQGEPTQDQLELLKQAVNYTQGLPLALVVLGRNLFDKDITFWKSELEKLSKIPDKQIEQILRTSFDGLEDTEKSIFLDIACVMEGWNKDRIIIIQDACGFYGTRGIARLADRALITISIRHEVRMHDLIKQIGQHIASHEGIKETGRPRRLWKMNEEVADVLTKTQVEGTRNIEVISMDLSTAASIKLRPKVFKKMSRLRILSFHNATASNCNPISLQKELNYLPGGLRYLQWDHYPLTSLPSRFNPCDLVELRMVGSNVTQLWIDELEPCLPSLKYVDLSQSKNLTTLPAFRNALKLEKLKVSFCCNLRYLPDSIQHLVELKSLHFDLAIRITGIPECSQLTKLHILSLHGCSKIRNLPQLRRNMTELFLIYPGLIESHSLLNKQCIIEHPWICMWIFPTIVHRLYLGGAPLSMIHLSSLTVLRCYEYKRDALPSWKGLVSLKELYLAYCDFESIQEDIKYLTHLWQITLYYCTSLSFIPELPTSLQHLDVINCTSLKRYEHISLSRVDHRLGSGLHLHLMVLNCINLEEDARNNIWRDFWLRVQFVLVPRVEMYGEQQTEEAEGRSVEAGVCIPGNGVPKMVKYSTIGSSLKVETNCGKRLHPLRFIFCAVVAVPRYVASRLWKLTVTCQCISKSGETFYSRGRFTFQYISEREHTIIWCAGFSPSDSYFTESTFQFSADAIAYKNGKTEDLVEGVAIVKCGVTPIGRKFGTKLLPVMQDGSSPVVGERDIPVKRSSKREHGNSLEEQPPHSHKRKKIRKASTASEGP